MAQSKTILVVDDEANLRKVLAAQLRREGYEVLTAKDGEEGLNMARQVPVDVVLTDLRMPNLDGMQLLARMREEHPEVPVVMLTAHGTVDTAVTAMKLGAFDYVEKPFDRVNLGQVMAKAAATAGLSQSELQESAPGRFGMIGTSSTLQDVFRTIEKVAASPSTVLVTGESGTGKELIASALHQNSDRAKKPFIKINCAAIPHDLIESELFGYEKGAFTGAVNSKPGRFELADGGTLFLDEIGEVPLEMQVKLLRALQESEFERVGGVTTTSVDVRLVAATNRDLAADVAQGTFREDLFYRLNVVPITLPALRERPEDIPALAEHFLAKYNKRLDKSVERIDEEAMQRLLEYRWPGNIRELENVLERAVLFAEDGVVQAGDLPNALRPGSNPPRPSESQDLPNTPVGPLKEIVRQHSETVQRELIRRALDETKGNVTKAARRLEISRKSLQNKMKDFGLREEDVPPRDGEPG